MALNEFGSLKRLVVKRPEHAFIAPEIVEAQWRSLNFSSAPNYSRALDEYDRFLELVCSIGPELHFLPETLATGLDSIYVRDASVLGPRGVIVGSMGKPLREAEPGAQADALQSWNLPIAGTISPPGRFEGGDVVWLDDRTVIVGRGYRTNDEGIAQFRALLGDEVAELMVAQLPHWRGPTDVFHLMSILSPVDRDLAVVYSPLMPVPLREFLIDRGIQLVDVPDEEFDTMGANVLALEPRVCVMLSGNPRTRSELERAGASVHVYDGNEISIKGGGGPTCLTRPIERAG